MPQPRLSSHLRSVGGERKSGEAARRQGRLTAPTGDVPKSPRPLPGESRKVWDRLAPKLHERNLLTEENVDLLWSYAVAVAQNVAAANQLFVRGRPVPMVKGDRGMVKNPAAQVFRDTAATMRQLAGALHLDELGVGRDAGGTQGGAGRLLS